MPCITLHRVTRWHQDVDTIVDLAIGNVTRRTPPVKHSSGQAASTAKVVAQCTHEVYHNTTQHNAYVNVEDRNLTTPLKPAARFPTLGDLRGPSSSSLPTAYSVSQSAGNSWNESGTT
eukprot:6490551-Amphidinium_carterae.1